jgi:DNA-directed RNA polymerase subunit RPC12/RpoP
MFMAALRCPRCGSEHIADGRSRLVMALGAVCIAAGALALLLSFTGPWAENWTAFVPLAQEDPLSLLVLVYGIVLLWGGSRRWREIVCSDCGFKWEPGRTPLLRPPSNHHPRAGHTR